MPTTKVTPRAKHPNKTKQFLDATQIALEMFDDEISSFTDEVKEKAYKHYIRSYREALVSVWNIARFANIDTVLKTVTDKKMQELKTMAERLKTTPPRPKAISDKTSIPDLETVTSTMLQKFPGEKLPTASTCEKIGNVFASLSTARTAYSEATQGLAQLATLLTPEQYTLVLAATVTPCIQLIVPGQHISPLSTPPPPQQKSQTAIGRAEIINFTKSKILPNLEASSLTDCDDNSATRVLAAAVYCQLEKKTSTKLIHAMKSQPCFVATPRSCQRLLRGWSTSLARITTNLKKQPNERWKQQNNKPAHPKEKHYHPLPPKRNPHKRLTQMYRPIHCQVPVTATYL